MTLARTVMPFPKPTLSEDSVVTAKGVTANIRTLEKLGLVKRTSGSDGDTWVTADRYSTPLVPASVPTTDHLKPDPYSLIGLQMRGFQVLPGKMAADNRVWVSGAYIRITEARKNGLI